MCFEWWERFTGLKEKRLESTRNLPLRGGWSNGGRGGGWSARFCIMPISNASFTFSFSLASYFLMCSLLINSYVRPFIHAFIHSFKFIYYIFLSLSMKRHNRATRPVCMKELTWEAALRPRCRPCRKRGGQWKQCVQRSIQPSSKWAEMEELGCDHWITGCVSMSIAVRWSTEV